MGEWECPHMASGGVGCFDGVIHCTAPVCLPAAPLGKHPTPHFPSGAAVCMLGGADRWPFKSPSTTCFLPGKMPARTNPSLIVCVTRTVVCHGRGVAFGIPPSTLATPCQHYRVVYTFYTTLCSYPVGGWMWVGVHGCTWMHVCVCVHRVEEVGGGGELWCVPA